MKPYAGKAIAALVAIASFAASCVATRPSRLPSSVHLPLQQERFESGLLAVTHRDASSPAVSVALAVRAGAADDPAGKEGLAHAVEHLVFRSQHRDEPPISLRLDRLGASFNAWTSSEATVYHATAPKGALEGLLSAFVDIARSPLEGVTESALDTERGVLDNERRYRDENGSPGEVVDRLRRLVHGPGKLGRPIGGTVQSLGALTIADAAAFAAAHYQPSRMTLVISGAIDRDTRALLEPFRALPSRAATPVVTAPDSGKEPLVDQHGIARMPSSLPAPELWLGFKLPSAYGEHAATVEIMAQMASGSIGWEAWERHRDVTEAYCFLDRGLEASTLVCRALLSSANDAPAVRKSLLHLLRKGIASRARERNSRYLYTRFGATQALLRHEELGFRTGELVRGAHFAKNAGFSLKLVADLEATESGALLELYDRVLTEAAVRAVLAVPGGAEQLAPPATTGDHEWRGAAIPKPEVLLSSIGDEEIAERTLENGLRVLAVTRPGALFQTALIGFYDGVARQPLAVAEATRFAYYNYLVEPPTGVLQSSYWDLDSAERVVRGPSGDVRVLLRRLGQGLDNYGFEWKSERYLDFAKGQKQREADPRELTERAFRRQLLFDHPYGLPVLSADVDAVTVNQIRDYYTAVHRPENALVVIVSSADHEALFAAADAELGGWQRSARREPVVPAREPIPPRPRMGPRLIVGHRPTESQASLRAGCVLPPSSAASVAIENVLSQAIGSALETNLRQRSGTTYGVGVRVERRRGGVSVLLLESSVAMEHVGPALTEIHAWFVEGPPPSPADLELARFEALRARVLGAETSYELAEQLFENDLLGFGMVDFNQLPKRIAAVELEALARLLESCRATSLVSAVGDEPRLREAWPGRHP